MKKFYMYCGLVVMVDDADYLDICRYRWHLDGKGYPQRHVRVNGKNTTQKLHRYLLNPPEGVEIDHIDGDKLNAQRGNLRLCTRSENCRNTGKRAGASSRFKGVTRTKNINTWRAGIVFNYKRIPLGFFGDEASAALAYDRKAVELFGEYAKLNFPKNNG